MIYSPSLMCGNFDNLKEEVTNLEAAGANRLHLDLMDGQYVPNFALGLGDVKSICKNTVLPTELHMMIQEPGRYIKLFADAGVDIIYFHPNTDSDPMGVVQMIRDHGKSPGIVINPETAIESLREFYFLVDPVLVMGVKPGNAGSIYLSHVDNKIERLIKLRGDNKWEIMVDGACSIERMKRWSKQGVDGFVLGTSALFGRNESYKTIMDRIRKECEQ